MQLIPNLFLIINDHICNNILTFLNKDGPGDSNFKLYEENETPDTNFSEILLKFNSQQFFIIVLNDRILKNCKLKLNLILFIEILHITLD